jgi:predicted helicase
VALTAGKGLVSVDHRPKVCDFEGRRAQSNAEIHPLSQLLIQQYLNQLQDLRKVAGTHREMVVREAFKDLLKGWAREHDLIFVPEYEIAAPTKERRYVDGALLHALRVPFGYWEAKDDKDDLNTEIATKLRRGYPQDNIIFEDSTLAVLIQNKNEVMRCAVDDVAALEKLLKLFFGFARPEVAQFRKAVEQFKTDLPAVLGALRDMIEQAHGTNAEFRRAAQSFLEHAQETINPSLTAADVREMLIQHVLTEEIFAAVFPGTPFHQDNNVARELYKLEATFFTGNTKFQTLKGLEPYYGAIRTAAAQIATHHEKQSFLKVIYEGFYKVYNPKAADRLGVVYTPNEIVRFMIESADWLCEQHFGRTLLDKDVEILDPATGTGTFVCELLEHFRGQPAKLKHKYREELHANEVAILPYYVANLNIEATYAAITGEYKEFPNLCFVDTLDNVGLHTAAVGTQASLFGSVTEENVARIRRQNSRKISVIIGNPPYNANQLNENENNKNREYPEIDQRIKATYIAASTAQKTKLYDMYARFLRWSSDRVDRNGIIAFVSNSSFIDSRTFDGFRRCVAKEFNEIWIVDLKGNARTAGEQRRKEGGNVFDDQIRVGVAVYFLVRKTGGKGCRIFYGAVRDYAKADEKREFLSAKRLADRSFEEARPDAKGNWINQTSNDFETLMPIATKEAKAAKTSGQGKAIFKLFSFGVVTNRDEWVYADEPDDLAAKVRALIGAYNADVNRLRGERKSAKLAELLDTSIKWTRAVKKDLRRGVRYQFERERIVETLYRPFVKRWLYYSPQLNEMPNRTPKIFADGTARNRCLVLTDPTAQKPWMACSVDRLPDMHFVGAAAGTVCMPLKRYGAQGQIEDNITDWALDQFKKHYQPGRGKKERPITKEAIFHYVYGVLHDPVYREKYALNLKRELPRIPFYLDFWQWVDWGNTLMDLHIGYETVEPWRLKRTDLPDEKAREAGMAPKAMLKADKEFGRIAVDSETTLTGVPPEAWDHQLGNRSALEWILDQYKEKKPKDPTIRAKFDTYRFAAHKEKVIDLLARVTAVSVATVKITREMRGARR